jgi:hypothetical protein
MHAPTYSFVEGASYSFLESAGLTFADLKDNHYLETAKERAGNTGVRKRRIKDG